MSAPVTDARPEPGNKLAEPNWAALKTEPRRVRESVTLAYEVGWRAWNHTEYPVVRQP